MSEPGGGGTGGGGPPYPPRGPGQPWPPTQPPGQESAPPRQPSQPAPPYPQPGQQPAPPRSPLPRPYQHQPYQPPAPYPQPPPYRPPQHQAPHQPPQPSQEAGSTMLGWQASRDPAWVPGPQRQYGVPPPSADESAPLHAPETAAATLALALRRAFRLYIDSREVTDAERAALELASPPIIDPDVQGFLAWRRSVHLVVAIGVVPLLLFQLVALVTTENMPRAWNTLLALQLVIDVGFAVLLWATLRYWTDWQKQRRILAAGWLAFFLMPFVFYLYPLRSAMTDIVAEGAANPQAAQAGAVLIGMVASISAMIELTPKAISLMPGLLRGAITSKLLFPGASAPGWLMLLLAPIYALLMYVVLLIPYQLTGNGLFVPAMIGLIGAQVWLGRMGYKLARPERLEEALVLVRKVRTTYLTLNLIGLVFVVFGLADLLKQLEIPVLKGVQVILSLLVNVLLLTLIATDQIVTNLVRGQKLLAAPGTSDAQATFARDIAHFDDEPRAPQAGPT